MTPSASAVSDLLQGLLLRTHLSAPGDLGRVVADHAATIGARDLALSLVDYEQATLVPFHPPDAAPLSVAGTVAGRAFSSTTILRTPEDGGGERLWLPLLDGTERLGVLAMSFDEEASEALVAACERFAHLTAMLVVTKGAYTDLIDLRRRNEPMTLASELVWELAPPLVFATDGLVVAGLLEPCYDNGGDALDYALNGSVLHVAVLDAMGHGLAAAGAAAFALTAYRHSRRCAKDLKATYDVMDEAVGREFPDNRFVTALIAELRIDSGRLSWISAGHPPPLVVRQARARRLRVEASTPLGSTSRPGPRWRRSSSSPATCSSCTPTACPRRAGPGASASARTDWPRSSSGRWRPG